MIEGSRTDERIFHWSDGHGDEEDCEGFFQNFAPSTEETVCTGRSDPARAAGGC